MTLLTDAAIRAIRANPPLTRQLKTDGNGLSLDILPSGITTWFFRYRLNGKQEKITLGQYPDLSLKAARAARDAKAVQVAAGKSPAAEKKLARTSVNTNPTVRQFGERYFREQVTPRWKNSDNVRRSLEKVLYPALGNKLLKDITTADIQTLIYRKRDEGKVASAIALRAAFKRMFDYAVELGLVAANPAAALKARYIGRAVRRERYLTPQELRIYLRTVDDSGLQDAFKLALRIILLTLVRKSELLKARWEYVSFDTGEWSIPAANSKTGKPHIVYLSSQAADCFRELKTLAGDSELVLPGRGSIRSTLAHNSLNNALTRLSFANVQKFTIHDSRRTASTLLHENGGFSSDVIEKALNHSVAGVKGTYNRAQHSAERKRMLQWWSDYVDHVVSGSKIIIGNFGAGA